MRNSDCRENTLSAFWMEERFFMAGIMDFDPHVWSLNQHVVFFDLFWLAESIQPPVLTFWEISNSQYIRPLLHLQQLSWHQHDLGVVESNNLSLTEAVLTMGFWVVFFFKYFLFSPLFGEDEPILTTIFSNGLVQPPTRVPFLFYPISQTASLQRENPPTRMGFIRPEALREWRHSTSIRCVFFPGRWTSRTLKMMVWFRWFSVFSIFQGCKLSGEPC